MHKTLLAVKQLEASEAVATGVDELKAQIAELHTKFDALLEGLARSEKPDTQTPANVQTTRTVNRNR
jgi:hypothetical protein